MKQGERLVNKLITKNWYADKEKIKDSRAAYFAGVRFTVDQILEQIYAKNPEGIGRILIGLDDELCREEFRRT